MTQDWKIDFSITEVCCMEISTKQILFNGLKNAYSNEIKKTLICLGLCALIVLIIAIIKVKIEKTKLTKTEIFAEFMVLLLGSVIIPIIIGLSFSDTRELLEEYEEKNLLYDEASEYYKNGNYEKAEQIYRSLLEEYPNNMRYKSGHARVLTDMEKYDEAIPLYKELLENDPDNDEYLNRYGVIMYHDGKYEEAYEYQSRAHDLAPSKNNYRTNMAMDLEMLGRYSEAEDIYKSLLDEGKLEKKQYKVYAACLDKQNKYKEALGVLYKGMHTYPNNADDFQWDIDVERIKVEIQDDNENPTLYNQLGMKYSEDHQFEESLKQFKMASQLDPANSDYFKNCAYELYYMGKYAEAIDYMNQAIELSPNYTYYYFMRDLCSIKDQMKAGDITKENWLLCIYCQIIVGRTDDASKEINSFQEQYPIDDTIEKYVKLNEAKQALKKAGQDCNNYYEYCLQLYNLEKYADAERETINLIANYPNDASNHDLLACIYLNEDKLAESIEEFKKAVELSPDKQKYKDDLEYAVRMYNESFEE